MSSSSIDQAAAGDRAGSERWRPNPEDWSFTGAAPSRNRPAVSLRWWTAVVLLVLVLGATTAWSVRQAWADMAVARTLLEDGRQAVTDADAASARDSFAQARDAAGSAHRRMGRPHTRLVGFLPGVGPPARTGRGLAAAAGQAAESGVLLADALSAAPGGLGGLAPRDGRIPLEQFAALGPVLEESRRLIASAVQAVESTPAEPLPASLEDAREEALTVLTAARDAVIRVDALVEVLPAFLGSEGRRTYFFAPQNLAELRGTGGYLGAYTIMTVDDGRFSFGKFASISDLPTVDVGDIAPPSEDFAARYDRYGGARFWRNINMTPDFPTAAAAIEALWAETQGTALDGVIVADPYALERIVEAVGSIDVPEVGEVRHDDVVRLVTQEAYETLGTGDGRKELLGDVAAAALQRLLVDGQVEPLKAIEALVGSVSAGHVLLHAADPELQSGLHRGGVAGGVTTGWGDIIAVVGNNAAANKLDYFATRAVRHVVWIEREGQARARTQMTFGNPATATGLPRYVVGPNVEGLEPGENRTLVSYYCTICRLERFGRTLSDRRLRSEAELDRSVYTTTVQLPAGEEERLELDVLLEGAWQAEDGVGHYRFVFDDQPTIGPTQLRLEVHLPRGTRLLAASPGMTTGPRWAALNQDVENRMVVDVWFTNA
jgi:hypothetical protein